MSLKQKFNNMKLASKISLTICSILALIFAIFIIITVILLRNALLESTYAEISAISKANAVQIQDILDGGTDVNESIAVYIESIYEEMDQNKDLLQASGEYSVMFSSVELSKAGTLTEEFLVATSRHSAASDNGLYGIGIMFEPEAFPGNGKEMPDYSFYADSRSGDVTYEDLLGDYAVYSQEDYYYRTVQEQEVTFTDPFLYDGQWTVTIGTPVIYQGKVMAVVISDIGLDCFDKVDATSDTYPSMYANIQTNTGVMAYDSRDGVEFGTLVRDLFQKESNYQIYLSETQKGQPFFINALSQDGSTLYRNYYPMQAGGATWWAMTAVLEADILSATQTTTIVLIVIALISIILISGVTVIVLRRTLKPINGVVEVAQSISRGNLNVELKAESEDEIGILTNTFAATVTFLKTLISDISHVLNEISRNNLNVDTQAAYTGDFVTMENAVKDIVMNLNRVLAEIASNSEQVSGGAQQLADASQSLAEGATDQASSVEELFALIGETTEHVNYSIDSIKNASAQVERVGTEVSASNQEMKSMMGAMEEITETSRQIENIINSIESIASQTNLLSLNAAIEAARAGDAGRGFAVVAAEIRQLSNESAEAVNNTRELIGNSIQAVQNGTRVAGRMEELLSALVTRIDEVVRTMDVLAEKTAVQVDSMTQVNQGIEQINRVVQSNMAVSEESAATSEELSAQAQAANDIVARFILK